MYASLSLYLSISLSIYIHITYYIYIHILLHTIYYTIYIYIYNNNTHNKCIGRSSSRWLASRTALYCTVLYYTREVYYSIL